MRVDWIQACEWEGLYVDGKLKEEGHSISVYDVLTALDIPFKQYQLNEKDEDALMDSGYLPKKIDALSSVKK